MDKIRCTVFFILVYGGFALNILFFYKAEISRTGLTECSCYEKAPYTGGSQLSMIFGANISADGDAKRTNASSPLDTSNPVVNPHPFRFTISNEHSCTQRSKSGDVFLVMLVKCSPYERFDREQIRKTWGRVTKVLGRPVLTMFLVGTAKRSSDDKLIEEEDKVHHDIIREDFKDTYYNLTYKTMMGWKWISMYCPKAKYVMSVDVDMMVNIRNLVLRLEKMPRTNFAEGNVKIEETVARKTISKWYMSRKEYADDTYPPFLNGGCYVVTSDVAIAVFKTSAYVPFFKLDDVYTGMVLSKAGVRLHSSSLYQYKQNIPDKLDVLSETQLALEGGIGAGIPHNKLNVHIGLIHIWNQVVGSLLQKDTIIFPPDLFWY